MAKNSDLGGLRKSIDKIDEKILELLAEREKISIEIGKLKRESGIRILDEKRESEVKRRWAQKAKPLGLDEKRICEILELILKASKEAQRGEIR